MYYSHYYNLNNNINMMNPMMNNNNNVNWMDYYNNLGNNNLMNFGLTNTNNMNNNNDDSSKWNITFSYNDQVYKELCHCDEKTGKAFRRFCRKIGIKFKKVKFIHNAKGIYPHLTFAEAGIDNNSKIQVIEINKNNNINDNEEEDDEESDGEGPCECEGPKKNIIFTNTQGTTHIMFLSKEHSIDTMLKKYLARIGKINLYFGKSNKICFLHNGSQLKFGCKEKIKDFFKCNDPKVVVNEVYNLHGA